jgi:hypothetical protein
LLAYVAISLNGLAVVPPVYEDEPWQASVGLKLATDGVLGSDVFAGFHGMERHYYAFMPVHPFLLALTYKAAGFGLFQTRLEPVAMGLLTLLLTYGLGRRLLGPEVGVLAVALLLLVRLTGTTRVQLTGILMLDMARIARYDMVVPVFGLLALHAYLSAVSRSDLRLHAVAGFLAALAGLSHLYGVFWIVCLGLLAWFHGGGIRAVAALAIGFLGPWLVYAAYVLDGVDDWIAQTREYGPRFDMLNPWWYWQNLVDERRRYGPGLGPPGPHYLARPGFWTLLVGLPLALLTLGRRALAGNRAAGAIVIPALVFPILFALLIRMKLVNYTVTVVPFGMIAVAWGAVSLWRWAGIAAGRTWVRIALAGVLAMVAIEGGSRIVVLAAASQHVTPYAEYIAKVRGNIPNRARVLGLHNYWFGLDDLEYRSWFVPLRRADPLLFASAPTIDQALDDVAPDVVLIDARMRAYFAAAPASDPVPPAIRAWMDRRGFRRRAVVDDETYGRMEIFRYESR